MTANKILATLEDHSRRVYELGMMLLDSGIIVDADDHTVLANAQNTAADAIEEMRRVAITALYDNAKLRHVGEERLVELPTQGDASPVRMGGDPT